MDLLTQHDLTTLIEAQGQWCISFYMPIVRAGTEVQQNPIRFRNLLRQAESRLEKLEVRVPDIEALLAPAQALLDDPAIWRGIGDGLAVFLSPEEVTYYHLPVRFDELVVVKERFHIKPLLPLISGDGRFYVLALSQEEVRLLEGSRYSVSEVELAGVPESLSEALQLDESDRQQLRAVGKSQGTIFQGAGESRDTNVKQIRRFFQRVDRGLRELIADKQVPLVLASVDYLLPIYRDANSYPHLLDEGLTGNPEMLSAKDLHKRAWALVGPQFSRDQDEQIAQYRKLVGKNDPRAENSLKQTLLAAHQGRIATLFVARDVQVWGRYDAEKVSVHVHPEMQAGDQDLLDLAAMQTFANGGAVYVLDQDAIPGGERLAAILRY